MKSVFRYLRLLPAVVIVGGGLLAIKGVDIARAAQAVATADPDMPDNSGLAPLAGSDGPATPDYADDNGTVASAAEVDVLSSLTRRRAELDARERGLAMRENLLNAGEGRVDQKIGALKDLQTQIQGLLAQRDTAQEAQIASLVKSYGPDGMAPAKAAAIFNTLPDEVLIPVAKAMKPAVLGAILAKMNPDSAQKLTVKLAQLLKLPEPAPAAACPTPPTSADAAPPAPLSTADGSPVVTPLQTAALTPPPAIAPPPVAPPVQTPPAATPPAPPPAQAAAPPKPHKPAVHHVTPIKPASAAAPPPAKPTTAAATPPAKPAIAAATSPAATSATQTAATQPPPATTTPAKPATAPAAASGPPTAIAPVKPTGG
jgi:flagellar motility protein MotE (MotC chaperone)